MSRALALATLVVGASLAAALLPASPAAAQALPVSKRDVSIASFDGTTLVATLYWDDSRAGLPRPAILMTHGWGGARADRDADARWLAGLGYAVLVYDSRGFGESDGTVGLNGPDEVQDVSALVDWLAARGNATDDPIVRLEADNDPRIGMTGLSYGGAIQLLAGAADDRLDALVPDITWNDLEHSLNPQGVVKRGWVDLLFWLGVLGAAGVPQGDPNTSGMDERLRDWYLEAQVTGRFPDAAQAPLWERSPARVLDDVTADILFTQGLLDTLFDPDEAARSYAALWNRSEGETHLLLHGAGHGYDLRGGPLMEVRARVERFLARHLDDMPEEPLAPVTFYDAQARTWRETGMWPPNGTRLTAFSPMAEDGGTSTLLAQAGAPTTHTELAGLEGTAGGGGQEAPVPTSVVLDLRAHGPFAVAGATHVVLNVTPDVDDLTLFFALVDQAPDGSERVVRAHVTPLRVEGANGVPTTVAVNLTSVAFHVQAGHLLALRVATSDSGYLGAREPGTVVLDLEGASVVVPVAPGVVAVPPPAARDGASTEAATGPGVLVVAAVGVLLARFRRRIQ